MHGVAEAVFFAACLGHHERNPAEVERFTSELIELATRQHIAQFLGAGEVLADGPVALRVTQQKACRGLKTE